MNGKMKDGIVKRGKTYAYVVSEADPVTGKKKPVWRSGFRSWTEAKAARDEARNRANKGATSSSGQKLGSYLDEWLEAITEGEEPLQPSTLASYRHHVRVHIKPQLGEVALRDITPKRLGAFYVRLSKTKKAKGDSTLSPATVDRIRATLRSALSDAVADGVLAVNAAGVRRKRRGRRPKGRKTEARSFKIWTPSQLKTFLDSQAEDRLSALWRVAGMTGMRRAELSGLRWIDVDLKHGVIEVRHTLTAVYDEPEDDGKRKRGTAVRLVDGEPKSEKGHRCIDLDEATCAALKAHKAAQGREKLAFAGDYNKTGLVFVAEDGTPLHPDWLTRAFRRLEKATDLPAIRLHDLRHTHASHLLAAGVPVHVVSQRLGHQDAGFTLRQYAHLLPRQQREAAELVAGLMMADTQASV